MTDSKLCKGTCQLPLKLEKELPNIIYKVVKTYLRFVEQHGQEGDFADFYQK
jgi:hypothetical protein